MPRPSSSPPAEPRWLLLIHQTPPKPDYLRVKIGRRLHKIGAVAIKSTVYALPRTDAALEDFQWLVKEVLALGGEATLCEARLVDGMADAEVEALFKAARGADFSQLTEDIREARRHKATDPDGAALLGRLSRRLDDIDALDFFLAPERGGAVAALKELAVVLGRSGVAGCKGHTQKFYGKTWVTRAGVHVDRMACAWLITRFIDPKAVFKFVPAKGYKPGKEELCFDMASGAFTHEGDQCTFEVLLNRLALAEPGLWDLAAIIHDLDIKDGKFGRVEAPGLGVVLSGIALLKAQDEERIELASQVFNALLQAFGAAAKRKAKA